MNQDNQVTQAGSDGSPGWSNLEFINLSGADVKETSDETRRRIRSHAQAHYRRVSGKRRPTTIELDPSPLLDKSGKGASECVQASTSGLHSSMPLNPGPLTLLDASRTDPFASFDVDNSRRARRLWDHVYDGSCAKFRALDAIGFLGLARETMALSQMLSASAWHLVWTLRAEIDQGDDAKYSLKTAQALRQRLSDPTNATSDEVVITVLAFAAYANLTRNRELFNIHFNGLQQILRHRGDDGFLSSTSTLRLAHFLIEVNGRFRTDAAPQFQLPDQLLAPRSHLQFPLPTLVLDTSSDTTNFVESAIVVRAFDLFQQLNEIIRGQLATRKDLWRDVTFAIYHLAPIFHCLLAIPRGSVYDSVFFQQKECFRLACILYIANLQVKFDPEPGIGMLYGSKLKLHLEKEEIISSWGGSNSVLIWILTVAACSSCLFADLRAYFLTLLRGALQDGQADQSESFLNAINGTPWCGEALQPETDALMSQLIYTSEEVLLEQLS